MNVDDDNKQFEGISNKLNVENKLKFPIIENEPTPQISNFSSVTEDNFEIVDAAYIANELKDLICKTKKVQTVLISEIKKGTEPRMYEVYSDIANSIATAVEKLTNLNKEVVAAKSLKLKKKLIDIDSPKHQGITMTPQQLAEMINAAKESTQLKEIDAKFVIDKQCTEE